jgi:hypothetical protein
MHRQNTEVNRQRGSSSRMHGGGGDQVTQLLSQQGEMEGNRQSMQTDDGDLQPGERWTSLNEE